jgi:hypothetical protein
MSSVATTLARKLVPAPSGAQSAAPAGRISRLWLLAAGLIAVGVIGRLVRYFLQFPIWGDEAFVCMNFLHRDYLGLTRELDYWQVAPVLFLWLELTVVRLLGASELAVRLVPLLAGLLSLGLFWRLARSTLTPTAAVLAVGLLAVARWPVSMSTFAKPYSLDLLMSLVLLVPAVEWLRRPDCLRWLVLLTAATPFALMGSYPAVFLAGAVSVALLPTAWRSRRGARGLYVAMNLLMMAAFLASYWVVGREQLDPVAGRVNHYLQEYWADAFPPHAPWPLAKWLVLIHTGRMMAYPVGDGNGGSALTFLLFAAGVWAWWKSGRRALLVLALTPFALNLLAAFLHRYPYGGCCRLSQHVAPAVCLLAGTGAAALLEKFVRAERLRRCWVGVLCALLLLCGVGGLVFDVARPYHDDDALWQRTTVDQARAAVGPDDQVVLLQGRGDIQPPLRWYLETRGEGVRWEGQIDWDRLAATRGSLWVLNCWCEYDARTTYVAPSQLPAARGWALVEQTAYTSHRGRGSDATLHCDVFHWVPPPDQHAAAPPQ